jgi:hypothetical protein
MSAVATTDKFAIVTTEQAECLRCDAAIPSINVSRELIPLKGGRITPTRQLIEAMCPHCKTIYRMTRELSGGQWVVISGVAATSSPQAVKAFERKISRLRGDIQIGKEASHARS